MVVTHKLVELAKRSEKRLIDLAGGSSATVHALTCSGVRRTARTARSPSGDSANGCTRQPQRRGKNGG
jgi:acetyl-CoA acetyltransferase